jgi:chromate transporter
MPDRVPLPKLFGVWLKIGCTSFGGGAVTQYLIQEHFIYKNRWIGAEEYAEIVAMGQIAPGINILSYTILIGRRLGGAAGVAVSLAGLIAPSATITVCMTAFYRYFSALPRVQSALRCAFAAIFGVSLVTNWRNLAPILKASRARGGAAFAVALAILAGSALAYALLSPAALVLYGAGALCGAVAYVAADRRPRGDGEAGGGSGGRG